MSKSPAVLEQVLSSLDDRSPSAAKNLMRAFNNVVEYVPMSFEDYAKELFGAIAESMDAARMEKSALEDQLAEEWAYDPFSVEAQCLKMCLEKVDERIADLKQRINDTLDKMAATQVAQAAVETQAQPSTSTPGRRGIKPTEETAAVEKAGSVTAAGEVQADGEVYAAGGAAASGVAAGGAAAGGAAAVKVQAAKQAAVAKAIAHFDSSRTKRKADPDAGTATDAVVAKVARKGADAQRLMKQ
jgi:hypothetical protein